MTPDLWVPGLAILTAGAAAGWWLTRGRTDAASATKSAKSAQVQEDRSLEVADLEQRREELYARLADPDLTSEARSDLELQAARVLKELDGVAAPSKRPARESDEPPARPTVQHSRAHSLITGFLFGGGTVALIALLVFWAERDAKPENPMMSGGQASPAGEQPHPDTVLPPEMAAEVGELQARIAADPQDYEARKRLALVYLAGDQYVPAFEQAEAVLAVAPDDIDSLYVQGVVRMTMGQDDLALTRLDRVLELFPDHVRAMTVKGLIFARAGDRDQAATIWNRALEVGGPQPQIENLLAMLESEGSGDLAPGPSAGAPSVSSGRQIGAGGVARDSYTVRVEADTIPGFPQTGVVFVSLRQGGAGPPVAVRRIEQPVFPLLVRLGPGDMMMASGDAELPASGVVVVRLDRDGNVGTSGEDDLEGSIQMSRGDLATIFLD